MLRRVVSQKLTDVSEVLTSSIIRAKSKPSAKNVGSDREAGRKRQKLGRSKLTKHRDDGGSKHL
jgi:hypothetical protein